MTDYIYPAIWAIGAIFGAGGAWAVFSRMQKDLNGLGRAVRRDRWNRMLADMVTTEKREDRERLAAMLRE
ncbi:MAG: hypothetical protein ACRD4R_06665 [Candidatus Acidiferrales bacterium]